MGYARQAITGISWMGGFRVATRGMSFLRTAIIARVLSPAQFGLFGITSLVLNMIEIITETGINIVLVQTDEGIEKYVDTAWVISILRGCLIALVIFISSFWVAEFFHAPDAVSLLMLVSVVPLLRGFINPAVASFQKELHFHKQFFYSTSEFFVESIVTIILVLLFKSPSAIVWGLIAGAAFEVVISFAFVKPWPKLFFEKNIFAHVIGRGKWVTLTGIFSYFFQNGDNIVVGRMLGTSSLAIYDMAYRMAMLPITEISNVISQVTFPVYVKISGDKVRLRNAYLKTTGLVALVCIPLGIIFLVFPKELVLLILGAKWLQAVPVFQLLAVFGIVQAIVGNAGTVFLAFKKQEYITMITLVGIIVMGVLIVPFTYKFGLIGAGIAVLVGSFSTLPLVGYFLIKLLK